MMAGLKLDESCCVEGERLEGYGEVLLSVLGPIVVSCTVVSTS